jgi:hypothetical protein
MTLNLRPDVEATLQTQAREHGLSVEDYVASRVARNAAHLEEDDRPAAEAQLPQSGMVMENGLLIYRTGRTLPAAVVDDAIRSSREERASHILGERG